MSENMISTNQDGDVVIPKALWEEIKELINSETSPDPEGPGLGFITLAEMLGWKIVYGMRMSDLLV